MDVLHFLIVGFSAILSPENLLFCFFGVLIGTLVGVLPGIGPTAAISILLPVTYHTSAVQAIILLAGIYYGAQYGSSTTSILVNIPGEASSIVTCLDGHQMALRGRAGPALGMSAFGSFIGGTVTILALMLIAPPLARAALAFGPPEYFSLLLLGVLLLTYLGSGSKVKSLMMAVLGLFLGTVGMDLISGKDRFVYGSLTLIDGIGLIPVAMGLYGVAEVLINISEMNGRKETVQNRVRNLLPNAQDWGRSIKPIGRGAILGFLLGILPGGGPLIASFTSYAVEKKLSKHPEEFGKGAIEGVAGPETANNAATSGGFIPLLTIGIPANAALAVLLGAFLIHGLQPGPFLMRNNPQIFWAVVASMYLGNVMLLALNLPLIGLWVQLLKIPNFILFPLIIMFTVVGCYSVNYNVHDVWIMGIFGILGYWFRKADFDCAPLVFGLILSPMLQSAFSQSMVMAHGSARMILERPITLTILMILLLLVLVPVLRPQRWMSRIREWKADS